MTRHRILSLTPATGWRAAELYDDGEVSIEDVAAWALVEVHHDPDNPEHEIQPVLAFCGYVDIAEEAPWFLIGPTDDEPTETLIRATLAGRARRREREEERQRQPPTPGPTAPPTPGAR